MSQQTEVKAQSKSNPQPWVMQMASLMKACADPTRLRLLNLLAQEGEICVCHLVDVLETNQPKVSRHLAYLKRAGLVSDRKDGLWVHYRLSPMLSEHAGRLIECLNGCAAEAPEMRRDIHTLRQIRVQQPFVKLTRGLPSERILPEPQPDERPALRREPEIQIELL